LTGKIEPKLFRVSGFAISCIGHMAILTLGLIFAGANPFDVAPTTAITVDIVSPDEVETSSAKPAATAEDTAQTAPSVEPTSAAGQPQPAPQSAAQETPPPGPPATRQALAATQAAPASPSFTPWLQPPPAAPPPAAPPPAEPPPAEPHESNPADMFGMPLALPDGRLGGSFDTPAIDRANITNDDIAAFHNHLKTCSTRPSGLNPTDDVKAVLRIYLKPDGTLAAPPQPIRIEGVSRGGGALYQSVVAALRKCQPYTMLPRDKYNEWKVFDLSFTPQNFGGG
jgi:hypothetical protein